MSRLSNLSTIKIGIFKSWNSYWFDDYYYSYLLFNDLKLKDYLSSIFYKLRIISDYLYIYRFTTPVVILKTNLIFLDNFRFLSVSMKRVENLDNEYKLFYNQKLWYKFLLNLKLLHTLNKLLNKISVKLKKINLNFFLVLYYLNSIFIIDKYESYYTNYLCYYNKSSNIETLDDISNFISYGFKNYIHLYTNTNLNFFSISIYINNIYNNFTNYKYRKENFLLLFKYYIMDIKLMFIRNYIRSKKRIKYRKYKKLKRLILEYSYDTLINFSFYILLFNVNMIYIFKYLIFNFMLLNLVYKNKIIYLFKLSYILSHYCQNTNKDLITNNIIPESLLVETLRENIIKSIFKFFKFKLEKSISLYENKNIFFYFTIFLKQIPIMTSAKIITDIISLMLESGNKIVRSFFYIHKIQKYLYRRKRQKEYSYYLKKSEHSKTYSYIKYMYYYSLKSFPLLGIRIECSGSFKKGKRSRSYYYTNWIRNYLFTGPMPNNTMIADIDYYQYFVILKSSSIGIKTWLYIETYIYNNNKRYIGIIY